MCHRHHAHPTLGAGVASRELGFRQIFLGDDWLFKMNDVGLNSSVLIFFPPGVMNEEQTPRKKCPGKMMKTIRSPGGGPRSPSLILFADIRQLPCDWSPRPPVCTFSSHHVFRSGVLRLYSNVGFSNLSTESFRPFIGLVFHAVFTQCLLNASPWLVKSLSLFAIWRACTYLLPCVISFISQE